LICFQYLAVGGFDVTELFSSSILHVDQSLSIGSNRREILSGLTPKSGIRLERISFLTQVNSDASTQPPFLGALFGGCFLAGAKNGEIPDDSLSGSYLPTLLVTYLP
jgi:hypothetical protein